MTKLLFVFYLVFATLRSTFTAATTGNSTATIQFPRIYVAEINTPAGKEPSAISRFPAEVDLLDYDRITDKIHKISFLVHDEQELVRLAALAKKSKSKTINGTFVLDLLATEELRQQITNAVEGDVGLFSDTGPQSVSAYSTIKNYPCYKNLTGSFAWLDDMVLKAQSINGLNVTKIDIGDSYLKTKNAASGYNIWALKVTGTAAAGATKGILFIMSGIHAREMAPPELTSRWVESLINAYGTDADITAMLDYTEIHLVVHANPDGRQVAETYPSVMRRKNMNPSSSTCSDTRFGVDLNRNFPFKWGNLTGSSNNKCSETYHGTSSGSEPEVKAIIEYTKSIFPAAKQKLNPINQGQVEYAEDSTVGVFLDVHAYGNLVLPPWSYSTTVIPPNNNGLTAIRDKIQYWTNYAGSIGYTAAGTTIDYAYSHLGTAAYTFELGTEFYQDCNTFESTIYPINLKPLMHLAKISKAPLSLGQGPDVINLSTSYSPADGQLTITAVASDSAWSKANVATAQQSVTEIRAFVDIHPYTPDSVGSLLVNGKVIVNVSSYQDGRHSVYVQAKDSDGYWGPVRAIYFVIDNPTIKPTTASPTANPSGAPSINPTTVSPTANPSRAPTLKPSASPTANPSLAPSIKATTVSPTANPSRAPSFNPTRKPSARPTSRRPTVKPTRRPSSTRPTSRKPTLRPTRRPTLRPTSRRPS
jgi:hypothetical protein